MAGRRSLDLRCTVPSRGKRSGRPKIAPPQSYSPSALSARLVAYLTGTSTAAEAAMLEVGWWLFPTPLERMARALTAFGRAVREAQANVLTAFAPVVASIQAAELEQRRARLAARRRRMQAAVRTSELSPLTALRSELQIARLLADLEPWQRDALDALRQRHALYPLHRPIRRR